MSNQKKKVVHLDKIEYDEHGELDSAIQPPFTFKWSYDYDE